MKRDDQSVSSGCWDGCPGNDTPHDVRTASSLTALSLLTACFCFFGVLCECHMVGLNRGKYRAPTSTPLLFRPWITVPRRTVNAMAVPTRCLDVHSNVRANAAHNMIRISRKVCQRSGLFKVDSTMVRWALVSNICLDSLIKWLEIFIIITAAW